MSLRLATLVSCTLFFAAVLAMSGCAAGSFAPLQRMSAPPCDGAGRGVDWIGPDDPAHRVRLSASCESVGPSVVRAPTVPWPAADISRAGLVVVTWNVHEGGGDLDRLLAYVRQRSIDRGVVLPPAVVLLVQEAFRGGDDVPVRFPATVKPPRRIHPKRSSIGDVTASAERLGLWIAYVPSMRNGGTVREDRGAAILSTLPLSDVGGIELPWVSQRRVAVMATVHGRRGSAPWRLRAISVHLDNRLSRATQAAALARVAASLQSDDLPIVIGGDLNTWFGPREDAVRQLDRTVPRVRECGDAPTFRFRRRLDHLFTTLGAETQRGCEIASDFFGSDHRPTILRLFGEEE